MLSGKGKPLTIIRLIPLGVLLASLAACGTGGSSSVSTPPQPPSASQVAAQIGASSFKDCGPAPLGGVTDSGKARYQGKWIGIDTFPGKSVRDTWAATAAKFGIVPLMETDTWVMYKATTQAGGCNT
jgi:hypothetical protein